MGKFIRKNKNKVNKGPKSRKEIRKSKRKEKKQRKFDNYVNRNKTEKIVTNPNKRTEDDTKISERQPKTKDKQSKKQLDQNKLSAIESRTKELKAEKAEHTKLQRQMEKQRKKQLQAANDDEDRNIKHLEKSLRLNKRKTKSIPKSFAIDGLDYLLEVCDPENMKSIAAAEQQFSVANDEFDNDFDLITGNSVSKKSKRKKSDAKNFESQSDQSDSEQDDFSENENDSDDEYSEMEDVDEESDLESNIDEYNSDASSVDKKLLNKKDIKVKNNKRKNINDDEERISKKTKSNKENVEECSEKESDFESENEDSDDSSENNKGLNKRKLKENNDKRKNVNNKDKKNTKKNKNNKEDKISDSELEIEESDFSDNELMDNEGSGSEIEDKNKGEDEIWEDIYGRTRNKQGEVVTASAGKYVPPALRNKTDPNLNQKQIEKIARIRRQLKGLLNRLAESNMHSIATQIEEMYMSNSRNDMNETLTNLIFEALISPSITPERLLLEHMLLITILHANVGTEIGAHFLQTVVHKFDELYNKEQPVENKELDNTVHTIAQLYNFKVFHSQLLYQILTKLSNKFEEKHVECILLVLKNVGFSLRKDDPLALKDLILDLQKKAATVSNDNSRVKFMLDILLAIKNNNMNKIPNYDNSYSEHLKKINKNFIRKGNYVTQLNISLEDLLKAQERGRWWIVGSAWTGNEDKKQEKEDNNSSNIYNKKILELARKQRMNTDTRRNIFCALMTAENYTDAFEKILTLGLKGQQEREIIHVLLHCSLQEKEYNPYYSLIANKFCEYDRKYQMMIRCTIWDKLKTLTECSGKQISILAKLLTYLFINQGLPISILKVIQFSELDQVTLRLIRQVLLGILLHSNEENCLVVFGKVAMSPKLKMFRESLRLFIHHFLLRNLSSSELSEEHKNLLTLRAKLAEKHLSTSDVKIKF